MWGNVENLGKVANAANVGWAGNVAKARRIETESLEARDKKNGVS
jgi:hypothetical protein